MNHLRTILAALLLAAAPAAAQTIKTLGYNTTNGQVVYSGTNPLTFTNSRINILETGEDPVSLRNQSGSFAIYRDSTSIAVFSDGIISFAFPLEFNNTTNAAITRTNLGGTTVGNAVFTATNAAAAANAIGLGATNNVTFNELTVKSLTTSDPVGWALDAVQTAAATNGVLTLPDAANVLRITNANAISSVTNGRLGAFYFLLNQSGTNLVISNSATITARGATNLTLGANESATLIATTATNATVH